MSVLLETSLGEIVIDLLTEDCPKASLNFLKLCKIKYYNFCTFHNVQKDFMCQTGDPTGSGKGGESVFHIVDKSKPRYFKPEFHPKLKHSSKGTVSMVISSSQISSNGDSVPLAGSQFFITLNENLDYLDGKYAVFGVVAEGLEILGKINDSYCDESGKPYRDIRIKHAFILEDPFDDPEGLEVPEHSPEPSAELLNTLRLAEDEELEPNLPPEELEKITREREARAQALTLEMVGDLPFADVKPPENVLFVCKLNPITRGEDLELIFSRFGPIASCEIIRDVKTGDSLSYAFVEFENQKDCEEAYFKMDNVLIDDRRIHVDFSQSVSKLNKGFMFSEFQKMKSNASENSSLEIRDKYKDFNQGNSREKLKYGMMFEHKSDKHSRDDSGRNQSKNSHKNSSRSHISKEKDNDRHSRNYDRYRDTRRERTPERSYKGSSRHRSRSPRRRY